MQAIEMVHMSVSAVSGDIHGRLVLPLLELSGKTDLRSGKIFKCSLDFLNFRSIFLAQHFARQYYIIEDIPHNRLVERASQGVRSVLRGIGRADYQRAVPFVFHKDVNQENR